MGISIEAYRAAIGSFFGSIKEDRHVKKHYTNACLNWSRFLLHSVITLSHLLCVLILLSGDVHTNPGPVNHLHDVSLCHANIRSLKANDNMSHVRTDLGDKYDVIVLTETWLSEADNSDNFKLAGYQGPIRKDREFGPLGYGGIVMWVRDTLAYKRRTDFERQDMESMWVEVRTHNKKFFVCALYRSESNTDVTFWDNLQTSIDHVMSNSNGKVMLIGDLNSDLKTRNGQLLQQFTDANNFTIHITTPTRITDNSATVIDQIITNFPTCVSETAVEAPVGSSDHCTVTARCAFKVKGKSVYKRVMWDFSKANFDDYREQLASHEWRCFDNDDVNDVSVAFTDELLGVASTCIPNKLVTVRTNDKPWYNSYLRRLRRERNRLFKNMKANTNDINRQLYRNSHKFYQSEISRVKNEYNASRYDSLASSGERNSKKWWSILKNIYKDNGGQTYIPPLDHRSHVITDDGEKSEVFNDFFLSMSALDDSDAVLPETDQMFDEILNGIEITREEVLDQLQLLDTSKAFGPDKISPKFLKEGAAELAGPLQKLFNCSIAQSVFPNIWKYANVLPLHKKNSKDNVNNYRPISLLSCVSKVFERIVFKHIYNHLRDNFVLSQHQSGFLPGRSTITQLLEVYNSFCQALDNGKEIRVIFLDISKAFDRVWHKGLLHKLKKCGIGGQLLAWFSSYLRDRQQRVVINGNESTWGHIQSGVPQGSVLGPLLFLIYINDLTYEVQNCNVRLFADDTCLFVEVEDRENTSLLINTDLARIADWASRWLVSFSPDKTKSLVVSNKRDSNMNPSVKFCDAIIKEVRNHVYLGLTFSSNLKWTDHIECIYLKARKRLSLMMPLKHKIDRRSLQTMFFAFVRPCMEYGNIVWGGSYDSDINKLEQINIDGMRLVTGATSHSNIRKLYAETGWLSVRDRIETAMLVMLWKVKNSYVPDYLAELLPRQDSDRTNYNLRNNDHIRIPLVRLELYRRSFFPTAIKLWNKLTPETRNVDTISQFQRTIRSYYPESNLLYFYGERWPAIHHARMRMGCSLLKYDLYYKMYVTDSPGCRCGSRMETAYHFFFECPLYVNERLHLSATIVQHASFDLRTVLYGCDTIDRKSNMLIFDAVHLFITESKRFN